MSRFQQVLAGALLLQVLLILLIQNPFGSASSGSEPQSLFSNLEAFSPTRVAVEDGEGNSIVVVREGDSWGIEEADGYPADNEKVTSLVEDLKAVEVQRPIVSSGRYHSSLKVGDKDYERHLRIWGESGGDPEVDLFIGTSPNVGLTNIRVKGDDRVYEVGGIAPYQIRAEKSAWIKGRFADLPADRVEGLKLTNAGGSFELSKTDGAWSVTSPSGRAGSTVSDQKVSGFLQSVGSLWVTEPAGAADETAHGFNRPAATFEIRLAGGGEGEAAGTETLVVGAVVENQDTHRYITRDGFGFAATISESSIKRLMEEKLSDFLD
jgi:hypothetical protein